MKKTFDEEFKQQSISHLRDDLLFRLKKGVARLDEAELWWRPNQSSNSVGNLLLHLSGNVYQWIVSGLGGKPDVRTRDQEFGARGGFSLEDLSTLLQETVEEAAEVIDSLTEEQLLETYRIQIYDVTGVQAVVHVVEHFSYHVGQVLFIVKVLRDEDLGFYANLEKEGE